MGTTTITSQERRSYQHIEERICRRLYGRGLDYRNPLTPVQSKCLDRELRAYIDGVYARRRKAGAKNRLCTDYNAYAEYAKTHSMMGGYPKRFLSEEGQRVLAMMSIFAGTNDKPRLPDHRGLNAKGGYFKWEIRPVRQEKGKAVPADTLEWVNIAMDWLKDEGYTPTLEIKDEAMCIKEAEDKGRQPDRAAKPTIKITIACL